MVYAIITAAGKGTRANLGVPKQFYNIFGKPIIIYTLETFEKSNDIDQIVLVVDEEHIKTIDSLLKKYQITKVKYKVIGGETNQMSIFHAIQHLKNIAKSDDIVLIHDGVRPLVTNEIIKNNLKICRENGNAITVIPCNEAMVISNNKISSSDIIDRDTIFKTQTPHSMFYQETLDLLNRTFDRGIKNSVALCSMLIEDKKTIYFSNGSNANFKITSPEDIALFEAYIKQGTIK